MTILTHHTTSKAGRNVHVFSLKEEDFTEKSFIDVPGMLVIETDSLEDTRCILLNDIVILVVESPYESLPGTSQKIRYRVITEIIHIKEKSMVCIRLDPLHAYLIEEFTK